MALRRQDQPLRQNSSVGWLSIHSDTNSRSSSFAFPNGTNASAAEHDDPLARQAQERGELRSHVST